MANILSPFHPLPKPAVYTGEAKQRVTRIRRWIIVFIIFLALSGVTAFPLEWEMGLLVNLVDSVGWEHAIIDWLRKVAIGVQETSSNYPFINYGTDWLAFAHLVIAVVFWGPYRDPMRNRWVLQFGMIACLMVFPLAFIAGEIRGIPWLWRIGDCLFGVFGFLPLWYVHNLTLGLELNHPQTQPTHE